MRTLLLSATAVLSAAPAVASPTPAPFQKGYHVNERYGFKFKKPVDFNNIPIQVWEEWLAAKYVSEQEFTYTDPALGYTANHKPEIMVVALPHEAMKGGNEVRESKGGDETVVTLSNPYRSYDDFLDRTFTEGGFFKSNTEEDEIAGVKVTKLTYLVEKLTDSGPQTISTWVYHGDGVDYAVQVIGLTNHWDEVEKLVKPVRQTFEVLPLKEPLKINSSVEIRFGRLDLDVKDKKEAKSEAVKSERVMHDRAIGKLPDEWDHKATGRILSVYHTDKKYADRVQKHTNNLLDWMDETFGFLGDGTYMRKPIVRICKDYDETLAYLAGKFSGNRGGTLNLDEELVTWWDSGGWSGRAVDRLNEQIYDYWMRENNLDLSTALPQWMDMGMQRLVENCRMDGRKVDWRYDVNLITYAKTLSREGNTTKMRDLFLMTTKDFNEKMKGDADPVADGLLLINYLASPEIKRHKKAETMLEDYLRAMIAVVEEVEKEEKRKIDAARNAAKKGDGEREYRARRRQIFEEMEKALLERTFEKAFGGLSDSDWADLDEHFRKAF